MWITDSGPTYRCMEFQGACATAFADFLRAENDTDDTGQVIVSTYYGCPQHAKSNDDKHFAVIRGRLDREACGRELLNVGHVLACLRREAALMAGGAEEHYIDWLPSASKAGD